MRLSDHLMLECGGEADVNGIFTRTCATIREAQRFELSDNVARAAYTLTKSKPTTLLSALPLSRTPYRKIWLEWTGGLMDVKPENRRDEMFAPNPLKQGALIESDASGQRGVMTFCWLHRERPGITARGLYSPANIGPLGVMFNWDEHGDVFADARNDYQRRHAVCNSSTGAILEALLIAKYTRHMSDETAKAWMEQSAFKEWRRFAALASEREAFVKLERHTVPFVSPHARGFLEWCGKGVLRSEELLRRFMNDIVVRSWEADIMGEAPFVETVVAMFNSRNATQHNPVDLSRLNKARAKRGKPALLSYHTTELRLSQAQTRAFRAGLMSREEAGRHTVRGHFKIRKTGVYWWSPFERGDPTRRLQRDEYRVDA